MLKARNMPSSALSRQCLVCGQATQPRYIKGPAHYWDCRGCGLLFQHPLPDFGAMQGFAEVEYSTGVYLQYTRAQELKYATFRERVTLIQRYRPGGRLLDVGCACGYLIDVALQAGYDAFGVEFSSAAIDLASPAAKPRIIKGNVDRVAAANLGEFDVITAFDIVEHSLAPLTLLGQLYGLLRPGGLVALATPDSRHMLRFLMGRRWPMLQPLQHTFLFSHQSMRLALERVGLRVITVQPAAKSLTLAYLIGQIEEHNPGVYRLYRLMSPLIPTMLRCHPFRVNIGEMLVLAARSI